MKTATGIDWNPVSYVTAGKVFREASSEGMQISCGCRWQRYARSPVQSVQKISKTSIPPRTKGSPESSADAGDWKVEINLAWLASSSWERGGFQLSNWFIWGIPASCQKNEIRQPSLVRKLRCSEWILSFVKILCIFLLRSTCRY